MTISRSSKSIFFFGIYIIFVGLLMVVYPFMFLGLMGLEESSHPPFRMLGMMLLFYGYIYIRAGLSKKEIGSFFKWTIHTRSASIIFITAFILLGYLPPIAIMFGVIELAGAAITLYFIRSEKKKKTQDNTIME